MRDSYINTHKTIEEKTLKFFEKISEGMLVEIPGIIAVETLKEM